MSVPTPDEVRVATAALHAEAGRWAQQSGVLADASVQAGRLTMSGLEAGVFQIFCSAYQQAQAQITGRCAEGRDATGAVADTLHTTADTYDREETANQHRFRDLY